MVTQRYTPLDALRGFIIIVMALDHANSFIAHGKRELELWYFLFPNYNGDALAFLTRLVTHLAAPGFFFLMGAGMALFTISRRQREWTKWQIAQHFLLRGALLILFQFTIENPAWDIGTEVVALDYFGVLYALGGAMMFGSLLVLLPTNIVLPISTLLILTTQLLLPEAPANYTTYPTLQLLFYVPGFGEIITPQTLVLYPILPWLGVMGLGIGYGRFLHNAPQQTYKNTGYAALITLFLFLLIRFGNGYGNIRPIQSSDWISYLNVVKYPPSLAFLSLTLSINLFFLWLLAHYSPENSKRSATAVLSTFGRVPLFFYFTHLYLYGYLGLWLNNTFGTITIAQMYPYWVLGLAILWPLCRAYGRFKNGRSPNSLWRFL